MVAVLLATLLSFAVARTITRPLAAITDVMREVAATGDLTRKIALRHGRRWDDEDARLLATTFNTLTDSIARFQREMSQKERLSSLGRLSTVIAHEVRNPLMIIKASVHALRQPEVSAPAVKEAIADIDEEVARLNRVVNEVLDFARPIRFELSAADLNALCRESAAAAQTTPGPPVHLDLDAALPEVTTDPERLRIALVNMLVNARHAVEAHGPARRAGAGDPGRAGPADATARRAAHARPRRPRDDSHRGPRRRHRSGRPAARLRSVLHHQTRRHRPRARDREKHHRRARRHDRRDEHALSAAPRSASSSPSTPPQGRTRLMAKLAVPVHPARRRRGKDPEGARPAPPGRRARRGRHDERP